MSQPEPADDQWAEEPPFPPDSGPSDRLPVTRFRKKGEGGGRGRDDDRAGWAEGGGFERVPPQDLDAEQSVLGGMLLSKDAIADVVEVLKGADFYRPAHETIYTAILDLYARGEPADPITVSAELTKRGEITRVGGSPYLHTLVNAVPTAANAEYYAEIVHERAVLRRLVEAGTRITQMGYAADGDVDEIVNSAQAEIYAVTEQRTSEDYLPLGDIMEGALDEIEAIGSRSGQMSGVPTGFTDLDSLTNGLHPGQMIVIAARPAMGKSTLALDFARACSIAHGMPSVIFSLEMGRNEIAMRLLSAEARVALHHMRSGSMTDDDWTRLARRMPDVSAAPLFIDDSPNLSMMEIRAKCRRLKQRSDLRLVVIDYLQLMQAGGSRRPESRQQEVSDMSRNLKLLAKELEVPVIALSQLNRGPEQRTDKKPMVSDLRESGCVTAGTRVLRADTGAEITMGELLESGTRDIPVWSLDENLRLVPRTMTHVFPSGVREVFRLRLASGREIEATANHPFLTYDGWKPLGELGEGSRLAVPLRVGSPEGTVARPGAEVVTLASRLGDGKRSYENEKLLPQEIFGLPDDQVRLFLRHLWATGGSVTVSESGAVGVSYATTSERLARDLQLLLLRQDVRARLGRPGDPQGRQGWTVDVCGVADQRLFLTRVGVPGAPAENVTAAIRSLDAMEAEGRFDTVPPQVWRQVRDAMDERRTGLLRVPMPMGTAAVGGGGRDPEVGPSRSGLSRIAATLEDERLELVATSDVFWDEIVSVESLGRQEVYDATVVGTHNFVANGIIIHNSIEQDADMVILLHREDAYEKESPRAGEADLIVAKHRNGPTATITVAFQGHYSRFVDMAQT